MAKILTDNVFSIILVDRWGTFKNIAKGNTIFSASDDRDHIFQSNLGIRNDQGKKDSVGTAALSAFETLYRKREPVRVIMRDLDTAVIMPIADQAPGTFAGTHQFMDRKSIHHLIIKILRNSIEFRDENRYHSLVHMQGSPSCVG